MSLPPFGGGRSSMRHASAQVQSGYSLEERLHRALQENRDVKAQRQELEDKVKELKVKFQRLTRELKRCSPEDLASIAVKRSLEEAALPCGPRRPASTTGVALPALAEADVNRSHMDNQEQRRHSFSGTARGKVATMPCGGSSGPCSPSVEDELREEIRRLKHELREAHERANRAEVEHRGLHQQLSKLPKDPQIPQDAKLLQDLKPSQDQRVIQLQQEVLLHRGELLQCRSENEKLRRELSSANDALSRVTMQLHDLQKEQCGALTRETAATVNGAHAAHLNEASAAVAEAARLQAEQHYKAVISDLVRERDTLALRLRQTDEELKELESRVGPMGAAALAEPVKLAELQDEITNRANQMAVITSRLQFAQGQVTTMKGECDRLVNELRQLHQTHTETKRQLFEVEHRKVALEVRCSRMDELEQTLRRKDEELVRSEEELLRMVANLQSCSRETEAVVRKEMSQRVVELQQMRDGAESMAKERERRVLQVEHELADAKRLLESAREDVAIYKERLGAVELEKSELSAKISLLGLTSMDYSDEHIHEAMALAAMRRRSKQGNTVLVAGVDRDDHSAGQPPKNPPSRLQDDGLGKGVELTDAARDIMSVWEGLSWNDEWEAAKLREGLSAAALDMEMAQSRCEQMEAQVNESRSLLKEMSGERDMLLEENLEFRRRLSHVQTVFAKQQLRAYHAAVAQGATKNGLVELCIRHVQCNEAFWRKSVLGGGADDEDRSFPERTSASTLFFTLDGFEAYDTMISPPFHSPCEDQDVHFRYDSLDIDEATVAKVQRTAFRFQLHEGRGTSSRLLAMAELPGAALLMCRDGTSITETLLLIDGEGEAAGSIYVEATVANLFLPVLLDRPVVGRGALSAAATRAALIALRSVRFLRIQVFKAEGLAADPLPKPFVFYTASPSVRGGGLCCIPDTVVKPSNRALTANPVFDAQPVDHRVIVDQPLIHFLAESSIVFVLFDEQSADPQANSGLIEVDLQPLLASTTASILTTEPIHPQGTLTVGMSWVCGPELVGLDPLSNP